MAGKIDFYVLETSQAQKSLLFACQLLEKAYGEQKRVYVHAESQDAAARFDSLLWTYRDDSFIPHSLDKAEPATIQLGFDGAPFYERDILLNLAPTIPDFYQQFNHIIEIVFSDPSVQQLARARYKTYRDQGFDITTHKLKAIES